ncbi:MAG: aminotransferase class I/II-fold pyridoxal phosphate-dependent enzyme [Bacteroidales bacterium]|nr:aminotransferase class I/II-fold pyridoxal phosphate-dependent enzyme [Bacteroidales bacterium]
MESFNGTITSKLPQTGTSVFAVMSQLAREHNAINLSQGFPDFPVSEELIDLVHYYMRKGYNQYAPMQGVPELRTALSQMFQKNYGARYDADKEINITAGATQALFTAISAFIREGDEAIIFEPAYDSYAPAVLTNGGMVKYASLQFPDFSINWDELPRMITSRTRLIIINSPHNPTGSILSDEDMLRLERITRNTDILIISDEVYEHLIFDNIKHQSVCLYPELASRSLLIGSFGKTFHATGWKTGFVLAPENLMNEFRKVHQFVVFAGNTPIQYAVANYLQNADHYKNLGSFFQQKRDLFAQALKNSAFKILPCHGTYFQLLDYSNLSQLPEMEFARWLVQEHKIAAIPVSSFYQRKENHQVLRFCFAKTEETLLEATAVLSQLKTE